MKGFIEVNERYYVEGCNLISGRWELLSPTMIQVSKIVSFRDQSLDLNNRQLHVVETYRELIDLINEATK